MSLNIERRRTVRIKKSALLAESLNDIDRPALKIADNQDELQQAFAIVHEEYLKTGYISKPKSHKMLFSIYNFLPHSVIFVAKSYLTVVSTLAQIFDSKLFGLPMDVIYREELGELRSANRKIVEIGSLANLKSFKWKNLFLYLIKLAYWHSVYQNVNDWCITVNPKHVPFYETVLLFKQFGPQKYHPKVNAPAVLLRLNIDEYKDKLKEIYNDFDFDCNLFRYFHRIGIQKTEIYSDAQNQKESSSYTNFLTTKTAQYFMDIEPNITDDISPECISYLQSIYPGLNL